MTILPSLFRNTQMLYRKYWRFVSVKMNVFCRITAKMNFFYRIIVLSISIIILSYFHKIGPTVFTFCINLSSSSFRKWIHVARSFVFCVVRCRPVFVFFLFSFSLLYYLSFQLRLLISPLVSSNLSFLNHCDNGKTV